VVLIRCPKPADHELVWRTLPQGRDKTVVESLARWVEDEYQSKRQERVDTADWPRHYLRVRRNAAISAVDKHDPGPLPRECLSLLWATILTERQVRAACNQSPVPVRIQSSHGSTRVLWRPSETNCAFGSTCAQQTTRSCLKSFRCRAPRKLELHSL